MHIKYCVLKILLTLALAISAVYGSAEENNNLRVGVLKYGTLNWEMDVIHKLNLAEKAGLDMEVVPLGSTQALLVALQSGSVNIVIGDWIWVARQQELDNHFYFFPYSNAAGALVVNKSINEFEQLRGKKLGVAGGKVNKNWILYSAFAQREHGISLSNQLDVKFAAPPMLNALMGKGRLDAVINFWHYSAELNDQGMSTLVSMQQLMRGLGIETDPPLLGWIFPQQWAQANADKVNTFLKVSYSARQKMKDSDEVWEDLPSMQRVETESLRKTLIGAYRAGVPTSFGTQERKALRQVFDILKEEGGQELVGDLQQLPENIFWTSSVLR